MSELFPDYRASWETDAHRELRSHVAEFLRKESTPNQERWAKQHQVDREYWNMLGDAGLLGLDLPEEYGGTNGDFGYSAIVAEELSPAHDTASGWVVHSPIVAHYINRYGNDEQKKRWMPGIISGELVLAIAMTEPGTGSGSASGTHHRGAGRQRVRRQWVENIHFQRNSLRPLGDHREDRFVSGRGRHIACCCRGQ